ncbi:MAG: hypothetical protein H7Z40_21490 [Phycisphaerae bacterium]|nr:hypothetical protein [Gemmatimonadaceae bacterium]
MAFIHIDEEVTKGNAGVPRGALMIAGAFAVVVISLAAVARIANTGTLGQQSSATAVASRALIFADQPDGSVSVFDLEHQQQLDALPTGNGGFVRGAMRALARQRRLANVGPEIPFYLVKWSDGRLTLHDSATANHLELEAFGSTNLAAFEKLLKGSAP